MIKLVYTVTSDQKDSELEWLRDQLITVAVRRVWNWEKSEEYIQIGTIVNNEQAAMIKLRRNLDLQVDWKLK